MGKEVEINGKIFGEDSKVTLSVKTLVWIICGVFFIISTLATVGYFDIKDQQEKMRKDYKNGLELYKKEMVKTIKGELKELREKDTKFIEDIGEMKGDIKVILDRTMRNNNNYKSSNFSKIETITPTGLPDPVR